MHELIERVELEGNRLLIVPGRHLRETYLRDDFYAVYDEEVDLADMPLGVALAPFVLNVAPVVWVSGERYHLDSLDADLAASLDAIREGMRRDLFPGTSWEGELVASRLEANEPDTREGADVGVLFSGGLDSICTSLRHRREPQRLIGIWGADVLPDNEEGWRNVEAQSREYADAYGFANSFVKSNFKFFLNRHRLDRISPEIPGWWGHVQNGMGLTGLALPLLYAHGSTKLYIAASHTADFQGAWGSHPVIDDRIRVAGIRVQHDAYELGRQQKLAYVVGLCRDHGVPKPIMRVCYANPQGEGDNCCRCEKCLRTIFGLVIENVDPRDYGFDVSPRGSLATMRRKLRWFQVHAGANEQYMWTDLQKKARSLPQEGSRAGDTAWARERADLLAWLRAYDFARYRRAAEPVWTLRRAAKNLIRDTARPLVRSLRRLAS